ncbi:MAG: TetR/AcrR family transcriptional regulator [Alphaproteobacteria bacterium]|nr:TetR/AcrR family transcriptional regulator [Alphaproteobacteria bacterium]
MARPREFDTDAAMLGAMQVFWLKGYAATNLPDLLDAMNITRGSFYKAFSDKESVYLAALDYYDDKVVSGVVDMLGSVRATSASACLAPLFSGQGEFAERGCFICNAMVDLAPFNPRVAARTHQMAERLRAAIEAVLDHFEIGGSAAHRRELSELVLHLYLGFQAMGRADRKAQDWRARLARLFEEPD